jgi:hypothetical protein
VLRQLLRQLFLQTAIELNLCPNVRMFHTLYVAENWIRRGHLERVSERFGIDELLQKKTERWSKKSKKTYNSGDSLVVTHLTTNPPVHCLYMAERTGSLIFSVLWSYVLRITGFVEYNSPNARYLGILGVSGISARDSYIVFIAKLAPSSVRSSPTLEKEIGYQPQQLVSNPSVARVGRHSQLKYNPDW